MAGSKECTETGAGLWLGIDSLFTVGLLIVELMFFNINEISQESQIAVAGGSIGTLIGTVAGLLIMKNGLTNGNFSMEMRTALTVTGGIISFGSLVTGLVVATNLIN